MRASTQRLIQRVPDRLAQHLVPETDRALVALLARVERLEMLVDELRAPKPVTLTDPVMVKLDELRTACRDLAIMVSWDGYVAEPGAARLLGKSPHTLKNWREQHRPLPFRKLGGRVQYDLADIATLIVSGQPETD